MATRRNRWKKILPTITLTAIPFTVSLPTAQGFFPPVVPPPPIVGIVVPPLSPPPIIVPPVSPPPFVPPPPPPVIVPPVSPPPVLEPPPCSCMSPPCGVPEPATIITGLNGLAAAAGYGIRRKDEKKDDAK